MRRVSPILALFILVAAAGLLVGCNEDLYDPVKGEGILTIEKIDPATVLADTSALDPNTGLPDQVNANVNVTIKNRPRGSTSSSFSDVQITKSERICTFGGNTIAQGNGAGGFTIPTGSSAVVTTTAVTVFDIQNSGAIAGDTWKCTVRFLGEDIGGSPVETEFATFIVNFADI